MGKQFPINRVRLGRELTLTAGLTLLVGLILLITVLPTEAGAPQPTSPQARPAITAGCTQVLNNGDFEGTGGWTEYSAQGLPLISNFPPPSGAYHSGQFGAYLADYNNAHDYIAQEVTLPADATEVTLRYWWQVETAESALQAYDLLKVTVDAPLGTPLTTLEVLSNQDAAASWQESVQDLLAYRGQTIVLRFDARTDANRPTAFYLDDITLTVCTAAPTATPTPTPTSAPPTATPTPTTVPPTATPTPTPTPTALPPTATPTPTATPLSPGTPLVYVSPSALTATLFEQVITFTVAITNVMDLGGFQFTLTFDPAVVHVNDITLGDFLGSTGRSVSSLPLQIDNTQGTAMFGAFSFGTAAGPSGAGTLATITLSPQAEGTSPLVLQGVQATDTAGQPISLATQDGQVTIVSCSPYDLDCDGDVDIVDIMQVAAHWNCFLGDACYGSQYDLDDDGDVDIVDIMQVAARWRCQRGDACYWNGRIGAQQVPTSRVSVRLPAVTVPKRASVLTVPVQVDGAEDVGGVQLTLHYDPTVVQVVGVEEGEFLRQSGRHTLLLPPQVDNQAGRATLGIVSYGEGPGRDAAGALLYVQLRPVAVGQTSLSLEKVLVVDTRAHSSPVNAVSGRVTVNRGFVVQIPFVTR